MLANTELMRVSPRGFVRRMLRDFDRFFDEADVQFERPRKIFGDVAWVPPLEVFERDHRLTVRVELPGMKKEEIGVTVDEEGLTIEGERKFEVEDKKNDWYRTERAYGKFVRTVPLPEGVKPGDITATFGEGVLEITMPVPLTAAATQPRKVEIGVPEAKTKVTAAA